MCWMAGPVTVVCTDAVLCARLSVRQYVVTPDGGADGGRLLDFGTLGVGESRDMFFYLLNENPIPVELRGWGSNFSRSVVELAGTDRGGVVDIVRRHGRTYKDKHVRSRGAPGSAAVRR